MNFAFHIYSLINSFHSPQVIIEDVISLNECICRTDDNRLLEGNILIYVMYIIGNCIWIIVITMLL